MTHDLFSFFCTSYAGLQFCITGVLLTYALTKSFLGPFANTVVINIVSIHFLWLEHLHNSITRVFGVYWFIYIFILTFCLRILLHCQLEILDHRTLYLNKI